MITLDLTPTEEAQIDAIARQIGIPPADYVTKLVQENLPPVQPVAAASAVDAENAAAIAQIQAWMKEEATNNPEEIRKADAELRDLMQNLDRNRVESAERPLFPNASHPA